MASRDTDTKTLLEKAEKDTDDSMATEKVKDTNHDSNEKDLANDNDDVEIKDVKLTMKDHDTEAVTMATKEESADEKTGLIDSDSSSSDSDDEGSKRDVAMATESNLDYRIDNLTKSVLRLEAGGDLLPDSSVHRKEFKRYRKSMKGAIPVRFEKTAKDEFPMERAGCLSLMTFSWQTSMMWKIYRKGVDTIKDMVIGDDDKANPNTERLERLWKEEVAKRGPKKASFFRAVFRFAATREILTIISLLISFAFSFSTPAFVLHRLLSYLNSGDVDLWVGIALVVAISCTELGRSLFFGLSWQINYKAGIRAKAGAQGLLFRKILKLRSLEDKTVGEIVNLLANDSQRIFDAVVIGLLLLPCPVILLMGLIYMLVLIGPWSLVAIGTFGAMYPVMYLVSKLTTYYRQRCIVITDKRVRMMNELLTCIKLIKMYAWEKSFAKTISGIRAEERAILEKGAYVQSISTAAAPLVPVMAAVFTFLGYILTGNELTAVEAFTIIAVLNSMRFTVGVVPFAVKALADAAVSFKRYKSILLMDEIKPHPWQVFNEKYALVLNHTTFRWEKESLADKKEKEKNKDKGKGSKTKASNGLIGHEELQTLKDSDHTNGDVAFVDTPTLQDLTFVAEKGKLIGICGSVGSGKSSLLSAVLGRMLHISGKVAVQGSLAYVTQQAWVMNTTVRENILFGEPYDPDRYAAVVESCALLQDFSDFVDGDQIEIGERGINLSGGQKQRISLARAVYSNKDIYLLDDPLSAVDIHIGSHIFSECILKQLKGKTVLFVTHQLQYLSNCDQVIFMRDGMITDTGTHSELMKDDTEYSSLIKMFYTQEKEKEVSLDSLGGGSKSLHKQFSVDRPAYFRQRTISSCSQGSQEAKKDLLRQKSVMSNKTVNADEEQKPKGGKLIVAEEKKEGKVGWPVYRTYIKAAGGYIASAFVILTFILAIGSQSFASWWLSYWLNQGSGNTTVTVGNETFISDNISDHPNLRFYTTVYGSSVVVMIVLTVLRAFVFMKATLRASSTMHNDIFRKMMASPMQFFDTTPVGRIVNRFSSDLDEIDVRLPSLSEMFLQNTLMILFALGMIAYVSPWFLIALVPMVLCFLALNIIFTSGVRELMRMNAITKSPLISHVTATVQGISTVHAYGKSDQFIEKFNKLLDKNSLYFYLFVCSNRWLSFRLDLMSSLVVGITGLCIVLTYDSLNPALAGLAYTFAIQMTGLFQFTIQLAIESESKFVAVQRLQHYSEDVETEAPAIIKDKRPPADWPKSGEIKFEKYKMKYRDNLPLALKEVGFTVRPKEKIGIVGRSGSGKSSLGVALFRLVEPASGTIYIDSVDITKIGLEDLRSRLAIIPQDPVLFVGTVRYNLDPFSRHKDSELWEALEKCHVKETISSLELKLDHMVVENGENFSVGERQLLCMARALLRNSKILMLDEATAAIDTETDSLVQKTIKEAFADCTMLIIAHRLNTVLGCDRILVMEEGKVVEYGRPKDLMASDKSKFKAMLEAAEKQQEQI
ncbi:ATP-binding cassette sub-family C member 5-like [Mercenaria mercenaria]|uniref:ATP-binding cassette sub-family C member 5-like n=1 Tax=Mercenaria mercenaria TaxID=6596 RepID=UPI00234ED9B9|nr:ATP-binding cassette sub-family C member 5-like [Mercenaria mercenaria]XP_053403769.1 ATP-binding cassette sub-family C member 5-like [Mercenaria mercenaria]